jgi:hypothetical protein
MKLWDYLNKEHGLILLDSEIDDILALARQEIELLNESDIGDLAHDYIEDNGAYGNLYDSFRDGIRMGLTKVRNPYPKNIRFQEDPEEFFKK